MQRVPVDPINNMQDPWNPGQYSYSYGNVGAAGQGYDLTTQLENSNDPEACSKKGWKYGQYDDPTGGAVWCKAKGGSYNDNIYEAAPDR